jgi:flagellar biosynthesis GTPase FlhF
MAYKSSKTAWFWLTLTSVVMLTMTEPLLNWLRAEQRCRWPLPSAITGVAAGLMVVGVIVQFTVREIIVSDLENRISQLRKVEEEKRQKAEADQRRREVERQAEAERLRQQAAREAEEARLAEQRRSRERVEEERRRRKEREEEERRASLERQQRETEARRKAEQEAKEEAEREAVRKLDLEKKGLPYYPHPRTSYSGRTADEWAKLALGNPRNYQALAALEQLKEEGMPYLLDILQKQRTLSGRKIVLQRIQGEYIHPNDLRKLLPYLARNRVLESSRDLVTTRMLALRCLHKQAERLKSLFPEIEDNLKDLLITSIYKEEIQRILNNIHEKTK